MANDQRSEERDACAIAATIILGECATPVACVVADISERGARILLDASLELPDNFLLVLPIAGDIKEKRLVRLRWRIGRSAGLKFERS